MNHQQEDVGAIKDLDDAHFAGSAESLKCTLILTEGYAAKSLAVAGLAEIGRDWYGIYPLTHRLINVRKSTYSEVSNNKEIKNIMKIMGLNLPRTNKNVDRTTLRYGCVMLMMDRDEDGSHMKGLVINLFHRYWPSLLREDFLLQFITPVVKVFHTDHEQRFYSFAEYESWLEKKRVAPCTIRFYKSLEAFTLSEIQDYFSHLDAHIVYFKYNDFKDDDAIKMVFGKGMESRRKEWVGEALHESFLYYEGIREISIKDFVNKEMLFYSDLQNLRSISSAIDGLTRNQRKVLYTCLKKYPDQEVNVLQLVGSVFEITGYKQSIDSLSKTIINMGKDFVGTNNINILLPLGQFGTRIQGGKDAGKVKYIYTKLNTISRLLFPDLDNCILEHCMEGNMSVEPVLYLPVIPLILVNGAEGIGTGWSTSIPTYNPKDVIENIFRMMDNLEPTEMLPWFKDFTGSVKKIDDRYHVFGVFSVLENNQIRITELPAGVWINYYKEKVLDRLLHNSDTTPSKILQYSEHHTHRTVDFLITLRGTIPTENELRKIFKLDKVVKTSNIVAFNHNGVMKKYNNPNEILKEFYDVRLQGYESRRQCMKERLQRQLNRLVNLRQHIRREEENITFVNSQRNERICLRRDVFVSQDTSDGEYTSHPDGNQTESHAFLSDVWGFVERRIDELNRNCIETRGELRQLLDSTAKDLWRAELRNICECLGIVVQETFPVEVQVADPSPRSNSPDDSRISTPNTRRAEGVAVLETDVIERLGALNISIGEDASVI